MQHPKNKIIHAEDWPGQKKKGSVVFTNGVFDLLHPGHLEYLFQARQLADQLVIGVNSDASVKRLKGPTRPVIRQDVRVWMLASFYFVDFVILFDEDTPLNLIKTVEPDVLVKGGDYKIENIVGADYVEDSGGKVCTIPFLPDHSTTALIEKIKNL